MENEFVTYSIAKKLNELGFNKSCFAYFRNNIIVYVNRWNFETTKSHTIKQDDITNEVDDIILAPLWQQAIDFLREEYDFIVNPTVDYKGIYHWIVAWPISSYQVDTEDINGNTWYRARENAIIKTLELIEK